MRALGLLILSIVPAVAGEGPETRYSLSVTDESEFAAGLRVPGADSGRISAAAKAKAKPRKSRTRAPVTLGSEKAK